MNKIEYDKHVIQDFIDLHFPPYTYDARGQLTMLCPFCGGGQHEEVTFKINLEEGVANCYRKNKCNFKGTVVFMVKEFLGCSWETAYEISTGKPPESIDEIIGMLSQSKKSYTALEFDYKYAHRGRIDELPGNVVELDHSEIEGEVCDWLYAYRGYDPDEFLVSHDLYYSPERRFKGRVLFKIATSGNVAYQAYTYDKEAAFDYDSEYLKSVRTPDSVRKTLNPSGEVLSRMLYNYDEVSRAAIVFIVEGIFDAARVIEHGFFPVAIFGCNLSITQALLMNDLPANEIVVCLDNGTEEASMEVLETLNRFCSGKKLSVMNLDIKDADPDNMELDDFIRCFLSRRYIVKDQDAITMLANMESK